MGHARPQNLMMSPSRRLLPGGIGKNIGSGVAYLVAYMVTERLDFRCVDKGTLHALHRAVVADKHVTTAYELVGAGRVENRAGVNHLRYFESDSGREVGFDEACNYIGRRTLCGYNHVHAYGTGLGRYGL